MDSDSESDFSDSDDEFTTKKKTQYATDSEIEYTTPPKKKNKVIPAPKSKHRVQNYRKEWEKEKEFVGWLKNVEGNKSINTI